jgi:hypothetical protein
VQRAGKKLICDGFGREDLPIGHGHRSGDIAPGDEKKRHRRNRKATTREPVEHVNLTIRKHVAPGLAERHRTKSSDAQPDYRVVTQGLENGAGWVRK